MAEPEKAETVAKPEGVTVLLGDCLDRLRELPDNSIDSVVTDPPYGLGFMGKEWDALPPGREWAEECLRVLKPGGHLLAFGGTRTWHRLAVAIEDAGFELRDSIAWMYGSGFPKSMDVSKAIDKQLGAERPVVGTRSRPKFAKGRGHGRNDDGSPVYRGVNGGHEGTIEHAQTVAGSDEARQWQGWGTALKPAFEPIVVARKPLVSKTVAANVLAHGTGALNIDGCRVEVTDRAAYEAKCASVVGLGSNRNGAAYGEWTGAREDSASPVGRFPANVVLDESQAAALDEQTGVSRSRIGKPRGAASGDGWGMTATGSEYDDQGGASRFFYCAKAPTKERPKVDGVAHNTVKPLTLMRWLVRLVTPPGGLVLEPFAGSGTTVEACMLEGFRVVAIERDELYLPLIYERIRRQVDSSLPSGSTEGGGS